MSERTKPHLGRARDGDLEKPYDTLELAGTDPIGTAGVADSVDIDGTRSDVGVAANRHADELQRMIDNNRDCVDRFRNPDAGPTGER
ncbi:hypothetical protein tb265_29260 [Gemmatimonadetes bacterium T265]|nr:hypothetical protein tb265_29260 [Gemmatimonadetes bacterium T265]